MRAGASRCFITAFGSRNGDVDGVWNNAGQVVEQVMIAVRNMSEYIPHASDMDAERRWLRPSLPLNQG